MSDWLPARPHPIPRAASLLAVCALAGGVAIGLAYAETQPAVGTCPASATAMTRLELLFGRGKPDGSSVTDAEWKAFLDAEVTPLFPDGLTVLEGYGQWRDGDAIKSEKSIMLVIWNPLGFGAEAKIEAIRAAYKTAFRQQSVMRVDGANCVSF
jgi:hypothetical protein